MKYLQSFAQQFFPVSVVSPASAHKDLAVSLESTSSAMKPSTRGRLLATTLAAALFLFLAGSGSAQAQTATVNWTNVHQVIDGFGASNEDQGASMSAAHQAFFFGTGTGQLGLSLLRVGVTDGSQDPGNCTSVSTSCAGVYISDMQAVIANGGRVYATPWSPPAAYETNGSTHCEAGSGNGGPNPSDYASYATWLANFVKSLKTEDGIALYAISLQNEPDQCQPYDSALWSAGDIDTFIRSDMGPTFTSDGLSTLIFVPEGGSYSASNNLGAACGSDSSCNQYANFNWHDYDASLSGKDSVAADPYPSGWPQGKKFWETEASCGDGYGPNFCESGFNTDMTTDGLGWAAVIDQRIAGDGANAWLYWQMIDYNLAGGAPTTDDGGLMSNAAGGYVAAKRAYVLGQYSKFVRPGYYRIDATHVPQTGVSVSAYQNKSSNNLVIIATNYSSSSVSQSFNITNAPTFTTLVPTTTSVSLSLATQPSISVSGNSFTYTLPAQSITTFVANSSTPSAPSNLAGKVIQ
jgi:glucuronoarabinoxylan endo-1,4-beta-xylanase